MFEYACYLLDVDCMSQLRLISANFVRVTCLMKQTPFGFGSSWEGEYCCYYSVLNQIEWLSLTLMFLFVFLIKTEI